MTFSLISMSLLGHSHLNRVHVADNDTLNLLQHFSQETFRNNTVVILFGDHGNRLSRLRQTIWGKLEERLPFMSVTLPPWFNQRHPELVKNLKRNSHVLTSHFDVYETLQHLLSLSNYTKTRPIGKSLFTDIVSLNRSCDEAGVPVHYCPCAQYETVSTNDTMITNVSMEIVNTINEMLTDEEESREVCEEVRLEDIIRARKSSPNEKVQKHGGTYETEKCDRCGVAEDTNFRIRVTTYEIVLSVTPSHGIYEATVEYLHDQHKILVNREISRVNEYGDQPRCIAKELPHLRKFCFCKKKS